MSRHITAAGAAIMAAVFLSAPVAVGAPLLYVYEGAGCTGSGNLPQVEAFLDRNVDGADDFVDYSSTWANAVSETVWAAACWSGQVPNLALAVPLAVTTYTPSPGSTQLADVAAGKLDSYFQAIGQALLANGFPNARIRLGWEENGDWYLWNAGQSEANWQAAFAHAYAVLKAVSPTFTIWFNPGQGAAQTTPAQDFPGLGYEDGVAWDVYASTWLSDGATTEPALYHGQYSAALGIDAVGSFESGLPTAVSEFGVGSRADGHGSCPLTGVNDCDDPTFMADALADFTQVGAKFVGYWDYDAGDYNAKISDGSRPQQALAFLDVFGSPNQRAIFNAHAAPFTPSTPPTLTCTNCHAVAFQNGPGHFMLVIWAQYAHPSATLSWGESYGANVYNPALGVSRVQSLGAASSWTGVLIPGQPLVIGMSRPS